MPSPPLDSTHCRTSSGVAYYHRLMAAYTVERRWAWHDITAFGQHKRSNDVGREMPTPPLDSQHGRTTSSMAFHYRPWAAYMVERRLAWHAIIAFRQHKRSNDVERGMTSPPLDYTHARRTFGVALHHRTWTTRTGGRRRVWHDITALGHHTWSEDVGCGMSSSPLNSPHGQTTSGVACHHRIWAAHTVK